MASLRKFAEKAEKIALLTTRTTIAVAALPIAIGLTLLQGHVIGPLTGNQTIIPKFLYNAMTALFGIKVVFNKASAPVVKDKKVWYVANHMSNADFMIMGSKFDGTFVGMGEVLKWPGIAAMARAVNYIGVRRASKYSEQSRAKIIRNFNAGHNTIMFPEGQTSWGDKLFLFRAGLITLLFGEKGVDKQGHEVKLKDEVVVQPVAIRVKSVNGKDAIADGELRRKYYSMHDQPDMLKRIWRRMQVRSTVIEVTTFAPLEPKNFKDARELINTAALQVAGIVNPGQTTFEKAEFGYVDTPKKENPKAQKGATVSVPSKGTP